MTFRNILKFTTGIVKMEENKVEKLKSDDLVKDGKLTILGAITLCSIQIECCKFGMRLFNDLLNGDRHE